MGKARSKFYFYLSLTLGGDSYFSAQGGVRYVLLWRPISNNYNPPRFARPVLGASVDVKVGKDYPDPLIGSSRDCLPVAGQWTTNRAGLHVENMLKKAL